jgi:hypothetical protein
MTIAESGFAAGDQTMPFQILGGELGGVATAD